MADLKLGVKIMLAPAPLKQSLTKRTMTRVGHAVLGPLYFLGTTVFGLPFWLRARPYLKTRSRIISRKAK